MKWDTITAEEFEIVNQFLRKEPLELDTNCGFKRYARRKGESDKLVRFESDVPLRLMKLEPMPGKVTFYMTFYEPREQLFMVINDADFRYLFSAESRDLLGSTMLWAIKQANKEADNGDDPEFGAYS